MTEQKIVDVLCGQFHFLKDQDNIYVQKQKRIFTKAMSRDEFEPIIKFVHDEMGFYGSSHVIGTDDGEDLGFLYVVFNKDNILLALRLKAPKSDPKIKSQTDLYPSLLWHERELVDLFGAQVEGLPEGLNYPLPDGWPKGNYPMRKEWNPDYFDKETMQYNPPKESKSKE